MCTQELPNCRPNLLPHLMPNDEHSAEVEGSGRLAAGQIVSFSVRRCWHLAELPRRSIIIWPQTATTPTQGTLAQPFATLEKARDSIRANGAGTAYLRAGLLSYQCAGAHSGGFRHRLEELCE